MKKIVRQMIIGLIVGVISPFQLLAVDNWETASIEESGFGWDVGERFDEAFKNGELKNLHSVIVVRNSRLVFERYYEGYDRKYGRPIGNVMFTPDTRHDLQSITKSIVSLLYGIALAEGKVPSLETPLVEAFPEYDDLFSEPVRRLITVKHALTMSMGLEWNEAGLSYSDPRNSWNQMVHAADKYRFVLSSPIVAKPGTTWIYSGGATSILGRLISKGNGKSLLHFANEKLFLPLGINDAEWNRDIDGSESADGGLRMKPRDLAKIGQLVLNQGRWNGVQLVPSEWLESSFIERPTANEKFKYGYQWWLVHVQKLNDQWVYGKGTDRWVVGSGYGGQKLIIIPVHQLVIVINAGNYGLSQSKHNSMLVSTIVLKNVLPAMAN
ncbi:serine hydrolase domain-containing protein [Pseudomonadota bacterium]